MDHRVFVPWRGLEVRLWEMTCHQTVHRMLSHMCERCDNQESFSFHSCATMLAADTLRADGVED